MAKKSNKDPERLAQVQQSDLAESRVNEEFIDWLKKWGNTILLIVLLIALVGVGWNWLQRKADTERDTAWTNLDGAQLPASLEEVAKESKGIDSVSTLALLTAADKFLQSVQSGLPLGATATDEDALLDAETRAQYLESANNLYAEAILSVGDYGGDFPKKLLVCSALFGQAAVAESLGDIDRGKALLAQISKVAEPQYPQMVAQANARTETISPLANRITLPTKASLPKPPEPTLIPDPIELLRSEAPSGTDAAQPTDNTDGEASGLIFQNAAVPSTTTEPAPAEPAPAEPAPAEPVPAEPAPAEPAPAEPVPAEPAPAEPAPAEPVPAEPAPAEPAPSEPSPGGNGRS